MRITLLMFVTAACGQVNPRPNLPPDAIPFDANPADAPTMGTCHYTTTNDPAWDARGPFVPTLDPAGSGSLVWVSSGLVPSMASFGVPFGIGLRITGLSFMAWGSGGVGGIDQIVTYQADSASDRQILSRGADLGRKPVWGAVEFSAFQPVDLPGGNVSVQLTATEHGYYIGPVTAKFDGPCPTR